MSKDHNSLIVGKVLLEFKKLDSTNEYAMNLVSQGDQVEGTVIVASDQIRGRGQMGTKWHSEGGANLTFSIILHPTFLDLSAQFYLNKAVSVAIARVLQEFFHENVAVKWPNDIYVHSQKIAGILIQNVVQGTTLKVSVVGVGLNVNQSEFPNDLPNPTSMALQGRKIDNIRDLLIKLLRQLDLNYHRISLNKHSCDLDYRNLLYKRQQQNEFLLEEGITVNGYIQDVNDQGELEVMINGKKRAFSLKEITYQ